MILTIPAILGLFIANYIWKRFIVGEFEDDEYLY